VRVWMHGVCREIDGSRVEVAANRSQLVIDVGTPPTAGWEEPVPLEWFRSDWMTSLAHRGRRPVGTMRTRGATRRRLVG
jgi:hypothetical protein